MTVRVSYGYLGEGGHWIGAPKPEFRKCDKSRACRKQVDGESKKLDHSVISIQSVNNTKLYERLKT